MSFLDKLLRTPAEPPERIAPRFGMPLQPSVPAVVRRAPRGRPTSGFTQGERMYQAAKSSRLTTGFTGLGNTSEDAELISSLWQLRARSRQLVRDSAYAKRAKVIVVNNVVGSGIGLDAQVMTTRQDLNEPLNGAIEDAWDLWCKADACHTGGELHFSDLERTAFGEIFETGECFIRKHYQTFGSSKVPLGLELVEAERFADGFASPSLSALSGNMVRLGVEMDKFGRPVAYWVHDWFPGDPRMMLDQGAKVERVPAEQMIHLRMIDRWPQTRGVPWMHAVIRKMNDMDGYSEAELVAARGAACYMATIETSPDNIIGEPQDDGSEQVVLEPGTTAKLAPGEKLNFLKPERPSTAFDPFMKMMLREMAAGTQISYESLSRDYSQSNYSSSRLGILDDRDLWKVMQQWYIRAFREPFHREWMQQAALSGAIQGMTGAMWASDTDKYSAAIFKPRGWSWVDPTKEVEAYEKAVRCGFTTVSTVVAQTGDGRDMDDILQERERELRLMKAREGLVFDTDPAIVPAIQSARPNPSAVQGEATTQQVQGADTGSAGAGPSGGTAAEDNASVTGEKTLAYIGGRKR